MHHTVTQISTFSTVGYAILTFFLEKVFFFYNGVRNGGGGGGLYASLTSIPTTSPGCIETENGTLNGVEHVCMYSYSISEFHIPI